MDLIGFIIVLILVGMAMWAINGPLRPYIWEPMVGVLNAVVIIVTVVWAIWFLFGFFGLWAHLGGSPFRHS